MDLIYDKSFLMAAQIIPVSDKCVATADTFRCEHKNKVLFPLPFASAIIYGGSGTGKSRLLCQLIPALSDQVQGLVIASVQKNNEIHYGLLVYAQKQGWDAVLCNTPQELLGVLDTAQKTGRLSHARNFCVIFDDWNPGAKGALLYKSCMDQTCALYRNAGCHIFVITQSPQMVSTSVRNNMTTVFTFQLPNHTCKGVQKADVAMPEGEEFEELAHALAEFHEIPYCYTFHTARPFQVGFGIGNQVVLAADRNSVRIPNVRECMAALVVKSRRELSAKASATQKEMGNDSTRLT